MSAKKNTDFPPNYNIVFILFIVAITISLLFYLFPIHRLQHASQEVKKVYFADNITEAHEKIIDRFNRKHAGEIEIVPVNLPFSKFNTNERKELIARTLRNKTNRIDVFTVDQIWVPRFAKWAEPLSRYFTKKERDEILEPALKTCYFNESLVSIPLHIDIGLLYYRKDLIGKLKNSSEIERQLKESITWDEFIKLRGQFGTNTPYYVFQGDDYEGLVVNFLEILNSMGGQLFTDGLTNINRPIVRQGCQLMVDLIHTHKISPIVVTKFNESDSYDYALKNSIPFFRGWPSFRKEMLNHTLGQKLMPDIGVAIMPHVAGHAPSPMIGGWNLMISRHSANKDEAVLFLKYILSDEAQEILCRTAGYLPILNRVYDDDSFNEINPHLQYIRKVLERGIYRFASPQYTKISDILSQYLHKALMRELSVAEALDNAEKSLAQNKLVNTD